MQVTNQLTRRQAVRLSLGVGALAGLTAFGFHSRIPSEVRDLAKDAPDHPLLHLNRLLDLGPNDSRSINYSGWDKTFQSKDLTIASVVYEGKTPSGLRSAVRKVTKGQVTGITLASLSAPGSTIPCSSLTAVRLENSKSEIYLATTPQSQSDSFGNGLLGVLALTSGTTSVNLSAERLYLYTKEQGSILQVRVTGECHDPGRVILTDSAVVLVLMDGSLLARKNGKMEALRIPIAPVTPDYVNNELELSSAKQSFEIVLRKAESLKIGGAGLYYWAQENLFGYDHGGVPNCIASGCLQSFSMAGPSDLLEDPLANKLFCKISLYPLGRDQQPITFTPGTKNLEIRKKIAEWIVAHRDVLKSSDQEIAEIVRLSQSCEQVLGKLDQYLGHQ